MSENSAVVLGSQCIPIPCPPCDGLCTEMVYSRGGGYVGSVDTVTIQPDGTFHATGTSLGDRTGTLTSEQFQQLKDLLVDWCNIREPGEGWQCSDVFGYGIEYNGRDISWDDCTWDVSDQLLQIASLVEEIARPPDVEYVVTGGIWGLHDTVAIQLEGTFRATSRLFGDRAGAVSAEQLQALTELLKDWDLLDSPAPDSGPVYPDTFGYQITYQGRTLSWGDFMSDVPDQLWQIATLIEEIAWPLNVESDSGGS